jgi:WD40 repeat protein
MKRTFWHPALAVGLLWSTAGRAVAAAPVPVAVQGPRRWLADHTPLPAGAVARLGTGRFRHGSQVSAVAFSSDGKLLASAGHDCRVRLWEVSTGQQLRVFTNFQTTVTSVAFSPDGHTLAATEWGGLVGSLHLLDVTGAPHRTFPAGRLGGVEGAPLAFSPDGKVLASGNASGLLILWDVAAGRPAAEMPAEHSRIKSLAYSPDGKFIACAAEDGKVRLWDVAARKLRYALASEDSWVWPVAFSPDGRWLFSGGGTQENPEDALSPSRRCGVRAWDVTTGKQQWVLEAPVIQGGVCALAVSPDGRTLAVGSRGQTSLWDLKARKMVRLLAGCRNRYQAATGLCFSPDGKLLAGGVGDAVCLWDTASGRLLTPGAEEAASGVAALALSGDGRLLAGADKEGTVFLWEFPRGRLRHQFFTHAWEGSDIAISPDGKLLAATLSDSKVLVWDTATGRQRQVLAGGVGKDSRLKCLAFTPDGRVLASGYYSAQQEGGPCGIQLWDVAAGHLRQDLRAEDKAHARFGAFAFSADGRRLTGSTNFGQTYRWQAAGERFAAAEARLAGPGVGRVAYSPSGWLADTQPAHSGVGLWNLRTKRPGPPLPGPDGIARGLAFSPDGRYLASASGLLLGGGTGRAARPHGARLRDRQRPGSAAVGAPALHRSVLPGLRAGRPATAHRHVRLNRPGLGHLPSHRREAPTAGGALGRPERG